MAELRRLRRVDLRTINTRVICGDPGGARGTHMTRLLQSLALPFEFEAPATLRRDPTVLPKYTDLALNVSKMLFQQRDRLPLLLLEDDCGASEGFDPVLNVPADADIVYLGTSIWGLEPQVMGTGFIGSVLMRDHGPDFVRIYNMLQTHAVLFLTPASVQRMLQACLEAVFSHKAHDVPMARQQRRLVALAPRVPLFYQADAMQGQARREKLHQEKNSRYELKAPTVFSPHLEVHFEGAIRRLVVNHDPEGHPHWSEVSAFPAPEPAPFRIKVWRENKGKFIRCQQLPRETTGG